MVSNDSQLATFLPDRAAIDVRIQTRRAGQPANEVRISTLLSGEDLTNDAGGIAAGLATLIADAARADLGRTEPGWVPAIAQSPGALDDFVPLTSVLRRIS